MEWMILPFKRFADFQGRSRRKEFWMFQLLNVLVALVLAGPFFVGIISAEDPELAADIFVGGGGLAMIGLGLYGLYALAALIPSIAVTVRRFHDRDMLGWWYLGLTLAGLIPVVGLIGSIALFVFMVLPGGEGPNRFGPDPKQPFSEDVFA